MVRVDSEIGPLQAVLVHTPGKELLGVTPGTREEYLYDDIIDLGAARTEHEVMVSVLRRFADVLEVKSLLREVLRHKDIRETLIARATDFVPSDALAARLAAASVDELITTLIEGETEEVGPIGEALNERRVSLPPLPNLFFTRDIGIVIGEDVLIGSMRYEARWSEELIIKTLFQHHPALSNRQILYDGSTERHSHRTLEGGDVHPLRDDLLVIGFSDRSSTSGLDTLCDLAFKKGKITDVIVVVMPGLSTAIHLDMLFTQVDHGMCVVSPPHFLGPERLAVLHRKKGRVGVREREDFFSALKVVDFPLEPILCGGADRGMQEREQWASGCNLLTLRPGVALAYERNEATLEEFRKSGFTVVDAEELSEDRPSATVSKRAPRARGAGAVESKSKEGFAVPAEKTVIVFRGSELVRGGGGPRCMTLPIQREAI